MSTNRSKSGRKKAKPEVKRGAGGRFLKGTVPGPGRPRLPPDYKAALFMLEPEAMKRIRDTIADRNHPRTEQAAEYVINRIYGTPTSKTEVSGPGGKPIEVDQEDPATALVRRLIVGAAAMATTKSEDEEAQKADDATGSESGG